MKVLDLLKAPGFGRKKPIKGKAVLTNMNSGLNLDSFKNQNLRVVQADPRDVAEKVKSLLEEFNN
jgi:pimeloyl-CoA synthetase